MSGSLSEIINRRRGKNGDIKEVKSTKPALKEEKETTSWNTWIVVGIIVVLLIVIFVVYWYWNRTPEKPKTSILEEMREKTPSTIRRKGCSPGVMSLEEFRDYDSKFSMTETKDFI